MRKLYIIIMKLHYQKLIPTSNIKHTMTLGYYFWALERNPFLPQAFNNMSIICHYVIKQWHPMRTNIEINRTNQTKVVSLRSNRRIKSSRCKAYDKTKHKSTRQKAWWWLSQQLGSTWREKLVDSGAPQSFLWTRAIWARWIGQEACAHASTWRVSWVTWWWLVPLAYSCWRSLPNNVSKVFFQLCKEAI